MDIKVTPLIMRLQKRNRDTCALQIPHVFAKELNLRYGSYVSVSLSEGVIVVRPLKVEVVA